MLKTVVAGAAALMIAAGAIAYAQQPPTGSDGGRHPFFAPEDRAALLDARIAALHAGLQLKPDQENAWPTFEQAYRGLAALRGQRRAADESLDPVQRAQRRAEALTARGAALKRYAEALDPLYKSLDDGQKRRFGVLAHPGHHFHRFVFWRGGFHGGGNGGPRHAGFGGPGDGGSGQPEFGRGELTLDQD